MNLREKTKKIQVGNVVIGGNNKVIVQSMTTCSVANISQTLKEIQQLAFHQCKIVRVAILDQEDIDNLKTIIEKSPLPIVADIHYVPRFALDALECGVHKIRLNPGNISDKDLLKKIILLAKKKNVPIRIGMNTGSIKEQEINKYGSLSNAMFALCDQYIELFNNLEFDNIILSFKASEVLLNISLNKKAASKYSYPIHLGVTESGGEKFGIIKSCAGLSPLLLDGIGNTIRISLTTYPYKEVIVAYQLLNALGIKKEFPNLVSCPTCGRMKKDITPIVNKLEEFLLENRINIKISIIGCSVNGLGEAARSDIGIVGANENVLYYKKGKFVKSIPYELALDTILLDIQENYLKQ